MVNKGRSTFAAIMSKKQLTWLIFIGLVLIWGTSFMLMKQALNGFNGIEIGAMRILFATCFVTVIAWPHRKNWRRKDGKHLAIVGLIGNSLPYLLFPIAIAYVPSGVVGVANSTTPLFTLIIGVIAFRKRLSNMGSMGVLVGLVGAIILIAPWSDHGGESQQWGYLSLAIIASACYGLSVNTMGSFLGHLKPRTLTMFALWIASIPSIGILLYRQPWQRIDSLIDVSQPLAAIAFLGIVSTGIATILFVRLIKLSSPLMAASTTYLIPIVALFLGFLDGEALELHHLVGMAGILLGVYFVNAQKKAS
jgi:drug/metabolite transporter (DMT)-like permease